MTRYEVFSINSYGGSASGCFWGVAVSEPLCGMQELLAPVFQNKYPAEVFAAWLQRGGLPEEEGRDSVEPGLELAREIEEFIEAWNVIHEREDGSYPTLDGRYPSPKAMAEAFHSQWAAEAAPEVPMPPSAENLEPTLC